MPGRSVVLLMGFDFDRNVRLLRQVGFNDPLLQRNKIRVRLDLAIDEEERPVGGASNNDLRKSGIVLNRERQNCGRVRLSVSLLIRGKEINLNPAMGCRAKAQRRKEEADADKQAFTHRVSANQCASLCVSAPLRDIRSSHRRI